MIRRTGSGAKLVVYSLLVLIGVILFFGCGLDATGTTSLGQVDGRYKVSGRHESTTCEISTDQYKEFIQRGFTHVDLPDIHKPQLTSIESSLDDYHEALSQLMDDLYELHKEETVMVQMGPISMPVPFRRPQSINMGPSKTGLAFTREQLGVFDLPGTGGFSPLNTKDVTTHPNLEWLERGYDFASSWEDWLVCVSELLQDDLSIVKDGLTLKWRRRTEDNIPITIHADGDAEPRPGPVVIAGFYTLKGPTTFINDASSSIVTEAGRRVAGLVAEGQAEEGRYSLRDLSPHWIEAEEARMVFVDPEIVHLEPLPEWSEEDYRFALIWLGQSRKRPCIEE